MPWVVFLAFVVLLPAVFAIAGGHVIMRPPRPRQRALAPGGKPVSFPASDGVTLRGWFFPVADPKGTIVYGPGRGRGLNDFDFRYISLFNRNGYSLLMFDARGLGASDGVSSMGALEWRDFLGAAEYLRSRGVDRMGFCGTSQGAAAAILAAARCPWAAAVVAEAPYASWETTLYYALQSYAHIPAPLAGPGSWLLARWLELRLGFRACDAEPVDAIGRITPRATLLIHGAQDPYIPISEMERLFAAAAQPKELWVLPEAGHTQALELRPVEFEQRVISFLDRWLGSQEAAGSATEGGPA